MPRLKNLEWGKRDSTGGKVLALNTVQSSTPHRVSPNLIGLIPEVRGRSKFGAQLYIVPCKINMKITTATTTFEGVPGR